MIGAFVMIAMIAFAAMVLEAGNAYAQQRVVQNGADAASNAGAVILAEKLAGTPRSDAQVLSAVSSVATSNLIDTFVGRYTNVAGKYLNSAGTVVTDPAAAARVGGGLIPPGAQGVSFGGTRTFPTFLGRAVGFDSFDASAVATSVTGRLVGGRFLPVVIPVSIVDCDTNGSLGSNPSDNWRLSDPGTPHPVGTEYIVPMCKTGGGSFQILDLDPSLRCDDEIADPPLIQWDTLPVDVQSDNGNNCAKPFEDYLQAHLGETFMIPICDNTVGDPCGTTGGSHASYRITGAAAFVLDEFHDSNGKNNPDCEPHTSRSGQALTALDIGGNGSSGCIVGWFVKWFTTGPVGSGTPSNTDPIGVQLIK